MNMHLPHNPENQDTAKETEAGLTLNQAASLSESGAELRARQTIDDALDVIPGGDELVEYFGLDGRPPQQPQAESDEAAMLIDGLRNATPGADLTDLFNKIAQHADNSDVNQDALRALRQNRPHSNDGTSR